MTVTDINPKEYDAYYKRYIDLVANGDLFELLFESQEGTQKFFKKIPEEKYLYRYEQGKWTILEIFQHLIDTERIFAYRAFRIGRMDKSPLQGFDQDDYINPSQANNKQMAQLMKEYQVTRQNTLTILQSLDEDFLKTIGQASGGPISVRAIMAILVGHETHHVTIIKERYL